MRGDERIFQALQGEAIRSGHLEAFTKTFENERTISILGPYDL